MPQKKIPRFYYIIEVNETHQIEQYLCVLSIDQKYELVRTKKKTESICYEDGVELYKVEQFLKNKKISYKKELA